MTVSAAQVFEEIQRIGREDLQLARPVTRGDRLLQDLALDSMTFTILGVALEDRFQVILSELPPKPLETVDDLAHWVAEQTSKP